jgi:glycine oxidase
MPAACSRPGARLKAPNRSSPASARRPWPIGRDTSPRPSSAAASCWRPRALAETLARRGVPIRFGHTVDVAAAGRDIIADCRGFAAADRLPDLRGVKGEMLILRCPSVSLSRPIRLLHPRWPVYLVPRGDGVFMLGATMVESGERSVVELLSAAYALHPAFAEAEILEMGADARPAFPDNLPRIRAQTGPRGRIVAVNGLFRHGFLLSPALARRAADLILHNIQDPEVMDEDPRQQCRA